MLDAGPLGFPVGDHVDPRHYAQEMHRGRWASFWGFNAAALPAWTRYDLVFVPILFPSDTMIARVELWLDSGGGVGNIEWGLYRCDQHGFPHSLEWQAPVPMTANTSSPQQVVHSWEAPAGLSWIGLCNQGASASIGRVVANWPPWTIIPQAGMPTGTGSPASNANPRTFRVANVTGALPAVIDPASLGAGDAGVVPQLRLLVAP